MNNEAASDAKIRDCNVLQGIIPAFSSRDKDIHKRTSARQPVCRLKFKPTFPVYAGGELINTLL
jgi:hypothetical protein